MSKGELIPPYGGMQCWGGDNDDIEEDEPSTIYLDTKNGDDDNTGRRGSPIRTFEELLRRLGKSDASN